MALPSSGAISILNVADELGIAASSVSLNDAKLRSLAGVSSGTISLASFYGKSSVVVPATVSVIVVAGGGGGMRSWNDSDPYGDGGDGGGGGAGGVVVNGAVAITPGTAYPIVVGAGGVGGSASRNGNNSTAFGMTAIGGGAGGVDATGRPVAGGSGGGGYAFYDDSTQYTGGGAKTQTSNGGGTGYGNAGAAAASAHGGGGGGGAGGAASGRAGGAGLTWNGTVYAKGGNGANVSRLGRDTPNTTIGGGGNAGTPPAVAAFGAWDGDAGNTGGVVLCWPTSAKAPTSYPGGTLTSSGGYYYLTFRTSGSVTF